MAEEIQTTEKNAIVAALLNFCLFGGVGYYYLGQSKKGLWAIIMTLVLYWIGIGMVLPWIFAYDAYVLGSKLANGESIRINECGLGFLGGVFGIFGAKDE